LQACTIFNNIRSEAEQDRNDIARFAGRKEYALQSRDYEDYENSLVTDYQSFASQPRAVLGRRHQEDDSPSISSASSTDETLILSPWDLKPPPSLFSVDYDKPWSIWGKPDSYEKGSPSRNSDELFAPYRTDLFMV
jgi:hypothetical protein